MESEKDLSAWFFYMHSLNSARILRALNLNPATYPSIDLFQQKKIEKKQGYPNRSLKGSTENWKKETQSKDSIGANLHNESTEEVRINTLPHGKILDLQTTRH